MKTKILLGFLILTVMLSCEEEKNTPQKVYDFSSITMMDIAGYPQNEPDSNDWRFDTEFSELEKSLFDSVDFSNINLISTYKSVAPVSRRIYFFPNPLSYVGHFSLRGNNDIMNLVIVDTLLNVEKSIKILNPTDFVLDFGSFENGYYRAYYAIQDSNGFVTGMGYGDIKVYKNNK